jgi:hypothetical protein
MRQNQGQRTVLLKIYVLKEMIILSIVSQSVRPSYFFSFLLFPFLYFSLPSFLFLFQLSYLTLLFQPTTIFQYFNIFYISLRFPSHLSSPPIILPPSSPSKISIFLSFLISSSIIFQFFIIIFPFIQFPDFHLTSLTVLSLPAIPSYNKSHHTSHNIHRNTVPR